MTEKFRVMQITNNLGIGGLERVVVNLCRHLDRKKFEVAACCLSFRGPFADELECEGIPVFLTPNHNDQTDYLAFWKLKDILLQFRPHIVHTHNSNALFDGFLASVIARVPVKIHTDHARKFPDKMRYMVTEWLISNFLNQIIAVSEETRQNLIHYEHIDKRKITIINNGIDGSRYDITIDVDKKKRDMGLDKFSNIVGLGVRLTHQKGITYLIKAAPKILEKYPDTAFVIAGRGYLLPELEEEVVNNNLENNFFFLGPRLDLPEILQIIDVYVLPSEWEGLPLVILEAMAARRAIVATDVGGNSIAISNGDSGYLIPAKNPESIAERVSDLLGDKQKRELFADNASKAFYRDFDVSQMIRGYEKIYLQSLQDKVINKR